MDVAGRLSFKLPESRPRYAPPLEFRTIHTKIELKIDFARKRIGGSCTLEIEPVRKGLETARFDACGLDISGVKVDGSDAQFDYDGDELSVKIGPAGARRTVRVEYAASPKMGVYFPSPDAEHPEKEVQAWTHTEAEESKYWFPCHDHPSDKSSSELILTVPKEFRVISNGKLLSNVTDGDTSTFHWKEDVPHSCYLTSFVAGKFGVVTQESRGVKLNYNFPEYKRDDVLRYFGETPKMIEVFEDLTGVKYPYLKYDQTTVEDFVAGGEENLNATTLATNYYPDAASEDDFSTSYGSPTQRPVDLVSHELAHQWFGDLVTCADWPHAWLNEGFASYFQELYLENTRGVDEAIWHLDTRAEDYFDEAEKEYRRPIVEREYVWPDDLFDAHLYPKGAAMLHQLRFLMGDEAFFAGISRYLKAHARSVADTHDFRKSMEAASGMQLEEFFEQSFFRPGHPEFEVSYAWDGSQGLAVVRVRQTQGTADGTPVYKLPCEIVFYAGGKRTARRVTIEGADQTFSFSLPERPTIVEFDPRRWLLRRTKFEKSVSLLLNQLAGSVDAYSRAEAAKELGKLKSEGAIEGLAKAAAKEQYWHVRACAFKALGEIGTDAALGSLVGAGVPADSRARRGMAAGLGGFKDKRAVEMLLKILESDKSPFVRCEAALSLAKASPEGALPHLKAAMKVHTVNETLAEACLTAMGKLKGAEVDGIVAASLRYGRPTRERVGALKAIKERGKILDEEVPLLRDILLHDKEFRVRQFLVNSVLRPLQDMRFLAALKEASRSDSQLSVRRKSLHLYHQLSSMQETNEAVASLRAEVEKLKEATRAPAPPA
ncbi:MAG: HEAT repeat domain-containing protein [Thaumarchaeota archaeon]|nr:HEAT repeat domain-containing protein [Nitrososphaerota archaeon]